MLQGNVDESLRFLLYFILFPVPAFSVDADGQQTLIGVKSTWWTDVGVLPLMTATSFLRKWAEDLIAEET